MNELQKSCDTQKMWIVNKERKTSVIYM